MTVVAGTGVQPAPIFDPPGKNEGKIGREPAPSYVLIIDKLDTWLETTSDKAHGNKNGAIVKRFNKPRATKLFRHPSYSLDGPGTLISVPGRHAIFFNSAFWI